MCVTGKTCVSVCTHTGPWLTAGVKGGMPQGGVASGPGLLPGKAGQVHGVFAHPAQ